MGWSCADCGYVWTDAEDVGVCPACGSEHIIPDAIGDEEDIPAGSENKVAFVVAAVFAGFIIFLLVVVLLFSR